uniref:Uncharacterized protein n=1 Tax=Chlamydomonas euryale TaxID=1486919 RepID=A0A6U2FMK2_9CHLO
MTRHIAMAVGEAVKEAFVNQSQILPPTISTFRRPNSAPPAKRFRDNDGGYRRRDTSDIRCWTCNKLGHKSSSCPERRNNDRGPPPPPRNNDQHRSYFVNNRDNRRENGYDRSNEGCPGNGGDRHVTFQVPTLPHMPCNTSITPMLPPPLPPVSSMPSREHPPVTCHHAQPQTSVQSTESPIPDIGYIADSGTTAHIANDPNQFSSLTILKPEDTIRVTTGGGTLHAYGVGDIIIPGKSLTLKLTDVLYAPQCPVNLLSIARLNEAGGVYKSTKHYAAIYSPMGNSTTTTTAFKGCFIFKRHATSRLNESESIDIEEVPSPPYFAFASTSFPAAAPSHTNTSVATIPSSVLHGRFAHAPHRVLRNMAVTGCVDNLGATPDDLRTSPCPDCRSCLLGKATRSPHPPADKSDKPLERLHSDLCGPFPPGIDGEHYWCLVRDAHTGYLAIGILSKKSAAAKCIQAIINALQRKTGISVECVRTDNGGEYVNTELSAYFDERGIVHELTAPYTSQSNAMVERAHRTVADKVRATLIESGQPDRLWPYAAMYVVYTLNRTPMHGHAHTPYELLFNKRPDVSHLRPFGAAAVAWLPEQYRADKLQPRGLPARMVGYVDNSSSMYKVYSPVTKKIHTVRHVTFVETDVLFPANDPVIRDPGPACEVCLSKDEKVPSKMLLCECDGCTTCLPTLSGGDNSGCSCFRAFHLSCLSPPLKRLPRGKWMCPPCANMASTAAAAATVVDSSSAGHVVTAGGDGAAAARAVGATGAVGAAGDGGAGTADAAVGAAGEGGAGTAGAVVGPAECAECARSVEHADRHGSRGSTVTRFGRQTRRPNFAYFAHLALVCAIGSTMSPGEAVAYMANAGDPTTIEQALSGPNAEEWLRAIDAEMSSLIGMGTFDVVDKPPGIKLIPVKWVFKTKHDAFGLLEKLKARLCAKGFRQVAGVDYDELYAPVTKHETLRTFLAFAAANDLELQQLDVTSAFLNGDLDKELWTTVPPGYEHVYPGKALRLRKAIYGLKQAPKVWWDTLLAALQSDGFRTSIADPCLLVKYTSTGKVFILVYVDDMLIAGDGPAVNAVTSMLSRTFNCKFGEARSFLGIAIVRDRQARTITLSQAEYVRTLATKYGLSVEQTNGRVTPLNSNQLSKESQPLVKNNSFAELVGAMLYLSNVTRPDIAHAVNSLASFTRSPCEHHWEGAWQVLRYLVGTFSYGLKYGPPSGDFPARMEFVGYCDSDFGGDHGKGRRSTTGYTFQVNGCVVGWQSKLQQTVARSSTEAEYQAMAAAVSEALYLRKLYAEFSLFTRVDSDIDGDFKLPGMVVFCDNLAAQLLAEDQSKVKRCKHIDIMHHFSLNRVRRGEVVFEHVPTKDNVADLFTKPLEKIKFSGFRDKLGVQDVSTI